jgi:beta-N-acetylhexosaminidase
MFANLVKSPLSAPFGLPAKRSRTFIRIRISALACLLALVSLIAAHSPPLMVSGRSAASSAKIKPYPSHPSPEALKWADNELRRMSLDEKIGQLICVAVNATFMNQDSDAYQALRHQVEDNHVGGIVLFRGPVYESVMLVNRMQQLARHPLLIAADLEAGSGMRFDDTVNFPWNMAVAATGNPDYARRQGKLTAREARALGVEQIYAPVADVNNNAANPVINVRSYGEDPVEVGRFAAAFIEGAQRGGVIATAKHFPGHGDTATDSHRGLPEINVNRERLNTLELVPFRAAVAAGVGSVMVGHIGLPQIEKTVITPLPREIRIKPIDTDENGEIVAEKATLPATLSPVVDGILRRDLGFGGIIVTDAMSMSGLILYFTQEEASVRAIEAGADLLLKPADPDAAFRGLRAAAKNGRVTEERIDGSARKVLAAKYDLGLAKERLTTLDAIDRIVAGKQAVQLADEIAEHAITLVRNDAHLLPLLSSGPGVPPVNHAPDARSMPRIFNLGITNGDDRLWITQAFVAAMVRSGTKVETMVLDDRSSDVEVDKALELAAHADLVIASMYGRVRSGQKLSAALPQAGARALATLIDRKAPVLGISFGNPYLLESFPRLQTYVVAYGDMPSLQQAAARAILGEIDITGRLPISLPGLYPRGAGIQLKRVAARP